MSAISDKIMSKEIEQQRLKVPTTPEYFRAQLDHEHVGEVKEEVLLAPRALCRWGRRQRSAPSYTIARQSTP